MITLKMKYFKYKKNLNCSNSIMTKTVNINSKAINILKVYNNKYINQLKR